MIAIEIICSCGKKFTGMVGTKFYCLCSAAFEIVSTTDGKGEKKDLPQVKAI